MNIFITGLNRGIGYQLAELVLSKGFTLYGVYRSNSEKLQHLKKSYAQTFHTLQIDLNDDDLQDKIKSFIQNTPIDILINNAGILKTGTETKQDFLDTFTINTVVPYLITEALLPNLKNSRQPKVAHITSLMGSISDNTSGGYYSYRSSKAALNMINRSLSIDQPWLITLVLHPGWVKTDMGGPKAPLQPDISARGLFKVIELAEKNMSGCFFDYTGKPLKF